MKRGIILALKRRKKAPRRKAPNPKVSTRVKEKAIQKAAATNRRQMSILKKNYLLEMNGLLKD